MRLVWRPGLRRGLLPQPSDAEIGSPAATAHGAAGPGRGVRSDLAGPLPRSAAVRRRGSDGGAAALPDAGSGRWQVAGRVSRAGVPAGGARPGHAADRVAGVEVGRGVRHNCRGAQGVSAIGRVVGRQVWDSRGRPTIEVEITLVSGARGRAIAPSGASTGSREALDKRDGGKRLGGYGVNLALAAVNGEIAAALAGRNANDQAEIDAALIALDGAAQKSRLGGNAIVATSSAVAWAAAADSGIPLWRHLRGLAGLAPDAPHIPAPMIQIFGGGRHAGNRIDIQDYLVLALGARSFAEATEWIAEVYIAAARGMAQRGGPGGVADEGGIWPDFTTNEQGLDLLTRAIVAAGFRPGTDIGIALDVAASSFAVPGGYRLALEGRTLSSLEMIEMLERWVASYPIVSLEDPLGEDDDAGFVEITRRLGKSTQVIGDDYLTTSADRIAMANEIGACNSVLLKSNQCGTLSELIAASNRARALGWNTIQSGRSGESEDVTLSHLAVGLQSDQIKVGSMTRSERTAKWNEVMRIESEQPDGAFWTFRVP
ncbi:MAG: phosphopyruvate hydratase [Devosia sp.]|nr:phosphopyruvate hydratase [Devosia sp.]